MKEEIKDKFSNFMKNHKDSIKHYNQVFVRIVNNSLENYQKTVNKILDKYGK